MTRSKKEIVARLEQLQSQSPSSWCKDAEKERENRGWLRHSQYIAVLVLSKLRELKLTQKELAERLRCSQQYVSKIVKGKENLSLETISKLEEALDLSFFNSPYKYFLENENVSTMVAEEVSL